MNIIELCFEKKINCLFGEKDGYLCYKKQIKNKINKEEINKIVFPKHIEKISFSYIEGLVIALDKNEKIIFEAANKELMFKINSHLKMKNKLFDIKKLKYECSFVDEFQEYTLFFTDFPNVIGTGKSIEQALIEATDNLKYILDYSFDFSKINNL